MGSAAPNHNILRQVIFMAKTNWQDPSSGEILSTHISGLQEAVGKIEKSIGIETVSETSIPLSEVFISNDDRCRIYQAPDNKRNWVISPAPIIKKNGTVISSDFVIDYGGGAVIFTTPILESDVITADATYTISFEGKQLSTENYSTEEKDKLGGIEPQANRYTHPSTHPASMIVLADNTDVETKINEIESDFESHKSDMPINVKSYGAKGDGITDDTTAFQDAINYALLNNKNIYIPSGTYKISDTLVIDRSGTSNRASLIGAGADNTIINYTGDNKLFYFWGNESTFADNNLSFQYLSGLTLACTLIEGSIAVYLDTLSLFKAEDLQIGGFDFGIYMDGVEHSEFDKISLRWNNHGIFAYSSNISTKTCPNNLVFTACHIGSNFVYGAYFQYCTVINFIGGSIENNGVNAGITGSENNWGIRFSQPGFQGGVACNLFGVYIESNAGVADVWCENSNWNNLVDTSCIFSIIGCTFNRSTGEHYSINNIRATFGSYEQSEYQKLCVINSSFKCFNLYVPNSGRKNIYFNGISMSANNIEQYGNIFSNSIEAPEFPKLNKMGSITRDMSAENGNVSYTDIGFKPKSIQVIFSSPNCDGSGITDGITSGCVYHFGITHDNHTSLASLVVDGTNFVRVNLVSFDNNGFTLSFTKTGAPTGTGTIKYIAQG